MHNLLLTCCLSVIALHTLISTLTNLSDSSFPINHWKKCKFICIFAFFVVILQPILKKRVFWACFERVGEMAEWSIAAVLKTVELRGSGGSNPSLSAQNKKESSRDSFLFFWAILRLFSHPLTGALISQSSNDTRNKCVGCSWFSLVWGHYGHHI